MCKADHKVPSIARAGASQTQIRRSSRSSRHRYVVAPSSSVATIASIAHLLKLHGSLLHLWGACGVFSSALSHYAALCHMTIKRPARSRINVSFRSYHLRANDKPSRRTRSAASVSFESFNRGLSSSLLKIANIHEPRFWGMAHAPQGPVLALALPVSFS